jgi:hypothetical protein
MDAVQIGYCLLVSTAAVASLLVVWRDDHRFHDRHPRRSTSTASHPET